MLPEKQNLNCGGRPNLRASTAYYKVGKGSSERKEIGIKRDTLHILRNAGSAPNFLDIIRGKNHLTVMSALYNVMGIIRSDDSGCSRHGMMLADSINIGE